MTWMANPGLHPGFTIHVATWMAIRTVHVHFTIHVVVDDRCAGASAAQELQQPGFVQNGHAELLGLGEL